MTNKQELWEAHQANVRAYELAVKEWERARAEFRRFSDLCTASYAAWKEAK